MSITAPELSPANGCAPQPAWRSFGLKQADLEANFRTASRPSLTTLLLTICDDAAGEDEQHWFKQSVSRRTLGLLQIVAVTEGLGTLAIDLRCQQANCREPAFEVSIPLSALVELQARGEAQGVDSGFRHPTGEDQLRWLSLPRSSQGVEAMARSLLTTDPSPQWMDQAETVLAEMDPLTSFSVTCACPGCGAQDAHAVDLEAWALARMQRKQASLIATVHRLAVAYGWTESTIMALPPWRRTAYERLVCAADEEQGGCW